MPRLKRSQPEEPVKLKVKKGDTVEVISGKDKGKRGEILAAFPKENKVLVQGANMIIRHTKDSPTAAPAPAGPNQVLKGGRMEERSAPLRGQSHGRLPDVQASHPRRLRLSRRRRETVPPQISASASTGLRQTD